ncbi:MAG TPA: hypothetical protein VHR72_09675 [Gemmataceae bacterium]|jgi:hypothetical protein|nr:hypothetical protein [Gemmataceae bacterium]
MLLGNAISRDEAIRGILFEDQIESAMDEDLTAIGSGIYAVLATYSALPFQVARKASMYLEFEQERLWTAGYRLSEMDDDYGTWDNHYWCSLVAAGFGGTDKASLSRRRAFWSDWLTRLAPKALHARSRLIAQIRRPVP